MVVRFAIEPDALIEGPYDSPRDMKDHHKRFIRLWEQYGLLVDPGRGPDSITDKFKSEPFRKVREMWQEAWKAKHRCRRVRSKKNHHIRWENLNDPTEMEAYEHLIDIALVGNVRGKSYLGIPEGEDEDQGGDVYSIFCGAVEAALFRYPEQSHSFRYIMDLSQKTVMFAHQHRRQVWTEWFQKLAQKSKEVVIIDRYGFSKRSVNGICWTLQSLAGCMSDGIVSIYTSNPSTLGGTGVSETEVVNRIRAVLEGNPRSFKAITVILVANQKMTKDRYIRFDECAFSIGHGVSEAFRLDYLERETPCMLDTQPRGILKVMRMEVRRLVGQPHRRLGFAHGIHVKAKEVVP